MSEQTESTVRNDWQDYLPWLIIFRAVRPAISFRLLLLSAIGLVGMVAGWRIFWDVLAYTDNGLGEPAIVDPVMKEIGQRYSGSVPPWPWESDYQKFGTDGPLDVVGDIPVVGGMLESATTRISQLTLPFQMLFRRELSYRGLAYALLCCAWALVVWAFFGGVMTRTVALKLTRDEAVSWSKVSQFTRARWGSYVAAPVLPIVGVFALAIPVALLGLIAQIDMGVLIAGILWPLAILVGLMMTILLLGLLFGWPLMWSTISTEGTDAFDAISRAYAYVFQRPFHYLFYAVVATVVGALGWILVNGVADLVMHCTYWAASWGASAERMKAVVEITFDSTSGEKGAALIKIWEHVVKTLAAAFGISFMWSASTSIYLLLRRQVDAVEMDEVHLDEGGQQFGLPPLQTDAEDVPGIADEE